MNKVNRKVLFIIMLGLSAVLLSMLITPSFATKYLVSDHNITPVWLMKLGLYRLLSASFGILTITYGTLVYDLGSQRLKEIQNWLVSKLNIEKVLVVTVLIVGSVFRFIHLSIVGINSPYKYGGLFLEFANQIAINNFLLPKNIPFYTNGGIPFAYPPLPFYIEAIAVYVLGIRPYAVVNILPPTVAILSLLSFYFLTREAELSIWSRVTALTAFAFMPNAFIQQIEGGGLAESFGTFALIWFFIALYRTYKHDKIINYFTIGLSWALCIVSSPGSAYSSFPIFLIFSIAMFLRRKSFINTALHLALASIVALIISSPYWITVIHNHGLELFLDGVGGQYNDFRSTVIWSVETLMEFKLIEGPYPFIWNLCVFIGVVFSFLKKRLIILAWFVVLVVIPREGTWMLSIPSAILFGVSIEAMIPFLTGEDFSRVTKKYNVFYYVFLYSGILLMVLWLAVSPFLIVINGLFTPESSIDIKTVEAIHWMEKNTNPNSKVVVISEPHVLEWIPQISRRTVINMPFGAEWQPIEAVSIENFQNVVDTCKDMDCILSLSQKIVDMNRFILFIDKAELDNLTIDLNDNTSFDLLWENDVIAIGELFDQ